MNSLKHYTPQRDFSPTKAAAPRASESAGPPMLSEEDAHRLVEHAVKDARAQAFADGEAAGRKAAEASVVAANAANIAEIKLQLSDFFNKEAAVLRDVEMRAVRLMLSVAQKVSVSLAESEIESFSADVARRALEAARGSSKIIFRISDNMDETVFLSLSKSLAGLAQSGRVMIERDCALPPAAVHVEWENGGVAFDPEILKESVSRILARACERLSDCRPSEVVKETLS